MILYLYALADRLPSVESLAGVSGEPLVIVETAGAQLIAGWLTAAPAAERGSLEAQDRVIRALHARVDALLPMRFGTAVADAARAAEAVEVIAAGLADRFALVRGREQMTLRVVRRGAAHPGDRQRPPTMSRTGTEYLHARAGQDAPAELAPLLEATTPVRRALRVERGRFEESLATVYELIDRGTSEDYRRRVREAAGQLPDLTVHVAGPAPAYAFAQP